jgi:DNA-binding transcriptional MerR regulator
MWTMEQLVDRVHTALAAQYPGAPNGRVRDLPDRRAIRWYSTIGLVDRPLGTRGRTALYGPRHLLQLVAIKRRQAAGRTLAEIQVELAGASDDTLAATAQVPADLLDDDGETAEETSRPGFWRQPPATAQPDWQRPAISITYEPETPHLRTSSAPAPATADDETVLTGLPLGRGVILLAPSALLPQPLTDRDRDEIAAAARPLLDLLASRGLTDGRRE